MDNKSKFTSLGGVLGDTHGAILQFDGSNSILGMFGGRREGGKDINDKTRALFVELQALCTRAVINCTRWACVHWSSLGL